MKLASIVSAMLAGGLVFGSAFSLADRPAPAAPPAPPAPPARPTGPKPPKPAKPSVSVHIDGIEQMIDEHMQTAIRAVGGNDQVPRDVRDKVIKRLESTRGKLRARAAAGKLQLDDLAEIGEEIGEEMEEFGKEMEEWGEKFGKQMQRKFGKFDIQVFTGDDDDDDLPRIDVDSDDDDLDDALRDLGSMKLSPAQREQIRKLRADSDAKVAAAKRELDRASDALRVQLENPAASDADISRSIDAVTQHEAAIRKARILAWTHARRVLDDAQRKKVEGAVKAKSR